MKFKLDENFGSRTQRLLMVRGFDAETVAQEGLSGCSDELLFRTCARDGRCLVTLDLDFCDVLRFPPEAGAGVVVIRVPRNPTVSLLEGMVAGFLDTFGNESGNGFLWIVAPGRIRVRSSDA